MSWRRFILQSSDGNSFILEGEAVFKSRMIKDMIEDDCPDEVIQVPFTGHCNKHADESSVKEELRAWDAEFLKVDRLTLFDLLLAAHHLNVDDLMNQTLPAVSDVLDAMSADEICKLLKIDSGESSSH